MTYGETWTREEHLAWAKRRALEYLDDGDVKAAVTSLMSDLAKHSELRQTATDLGPLAIAAVWSNNVSNARRFIEGFK